MNNDLKDNQKIERNAFLVKLENLGKKRKRLLIVTIVLLFSMAIGLEMMPDAKEQSNYVADKKEENKSEEVKEPETEVAYELESKPEEVKKEPEKLKTEEKKIGTPAPVVEKKAEEPSPAQTQENKQTVSQKGAIQTAQNYLRIKGFSRSGLIEQLKFEQFSEADATYAVDNIKIDYNEQAKKSAESYMSIKGFSRGGLIDQLKFEGFTQSQVEYGADSVGL